MLHVPLKLGPMPGLDQPGVGSCTSAWPSSRCGRMLLARPALLLRVQTGASLGVGSCTLGSACLASCWGRRSLGQPALLLELLLAPSHAGSMCSLRCARLSPGRSMPDRWLGGLRRVGCCVALVCCCMELAARLGPCMTCMACMLLGAPLAGIWCRPHV